MLTTMAVLGGGALAGTVTTYAGVKAVKKIKERRNKKRAGNLRKELPSTEHETPRQVPYEANE